MLSAIILAVLTAIAYSSGSHLADDRSRRPTSDRHLSDHNRHLPAPHDQYPVNTRHVLGGPKHFPYTEEDLADSRKLSVDRADSKLPGDDYNSRSTYNGLAQQASTSAFEDQTGDSFEYNYDQPSMDRFVPTKDYSAAVFDYPEDGQFSFGHSADVDTVSKVDSKREATIDLNENDPSRYSSEKYDGQVDISPEQLRAKDKLQPVKKPGPFISSSYNPDTDVQTTEDQSMEDQSMEDQSTEDQSTEDQSTEDQSTEDQNTEDQNTEDQTKSQDEPKSLLESRLDQMNRLMSGNSQNTFSGKGKASGLPMDVLHELELIGGPYASLLNEDSLHEALGSNSMSKTYQPVTSNKQAENQTGVVLDKRFPGEGNQTGDRSEGNHTMPRSVLNQTYFEDQHGLDDSNETLAVEHCGKNCKNRSKQDEAHAPTNHLGDAQTVGEQSDYDGDNGTSREGLAGFLPDDKNSSTTYSKNVNQDLSDGKNKSFVKNTRSFKNSSEDIYPLDSSRDQVNLTEFRIASDVDAQSKGNGSSDKQNQSDYERSKPYDQTSLHHIQNHSGKDQFGKTFFQFGNDTENDLEDQENQSVGSEDQDDKLESESQEDDEHNESENGDVRDKTTKSRHGNGRLSEVSKVSNTVLSANENHVNNENKETEHSDLLRDQGDLDINSGEVDSADNDPKHKDEYYRKRLEELIRKRLDTVIPEAIDQLDEEALASAFSRKPASQKNKSTRATEIKTVRYAARKFENLNREENSSESRVLHDYLQEFVHKFHAMIKDVRGNKVIIFQEANSTDNTNKTGVFPFERAVKSEKGNGDFNIDKNETHTEQQLNETGITFSNNETKSSGQMLNDGNHSNSSSEANNQKGQLDQNSFLNHTGTNSSTAGNTSGIASNESQNETRNSLSTETPAGSSRAAFGELNDTAADQSGNSSSKFEKTSDRLEEELDRFKTTHHAQFKNKTDNEIGNKTDNEINTTDHESGKNHSVGNKTYDQFTNNTDYHERKTTDEPDNEKLNRSEISDKPSTSDILDVSPFDKNDKAMDSSESGLQEGLYSIFSAETVMKTHGYFPGSHGDKTVKKPSYKPYDRFDYSTHDSGLGPSGYQSHQSGDDHQRLKNLRKQSTWFSPNDVFRPAGSSHNKIYPSGYKVPQSHEVLDRPGYDPERAFGYKFKGSGNPFQTADGYSNSRTSRGLVDKANKRSTAFDPRYYKLYPQQGYQPRVRPYDLVYGNPVKAAYGPSYSYNDVRYYKGRRPSYRSYPVQVVFTPDKRAYEPSQESLSALRAFPYGANHDYTPEMADFSSKGAYGRPVYRTSYGLGGRSGSMPVNFHWRSNRPMGNEGPSYTSYKNPVHGAYAGSDYTVYNRPLRTVYSLAPERDSYTHFKVFNHPPFFQYSPFDYNAPRSHSETPGLSPVVGHGHTPARALGKIRNARDKVPNLFRVSTMPVFQMYTPYDDAGYSKSSDPGFSVDKARHHITPDFKIHSSSGGETPQMDDRVDYSILGSDNDGQKYHQFGKDYLEKIYDRLDPEVVKSVEAILLKFPARKDAEDSERNGLGTATLDQSGEKDAEDLSDDGGKLNKTDNILDRPADNGTLELDRKRNSSEVNGTTGLDQSQYNTTNSGREMKNDELNGTSTPDMINATHELRNDSGSQDNRTASLYQPLHKDGQNKTVILSNNPPHSVSNLRRKELFFDSSDMAKVEQFVCPKGSYLSGIQSWVGLDEWSYVRNYRRHFNFSCRTLPNFGAKYETVCLWAGHSRWLKPSSFNCGGQAVITGWRLFHSKMGLDYSMAFLCCFPASPEGEPILTLTQCRLTPHYVNLQHGKINFTMPGSAVLYGVRSDVTYAVDRRFTFEYCQPLPNCSPAQDTATSGQDG